MIALQIHIYKLHELPEDARICAIEEHRAFMLDTLQPDYDDGVTDWDDPIKMQWYHEDWNYIADNDAPIIESIEANDYYFYYDGRLCPVVTYCGNHPRTGQTDITIHGETFTIREENTDAEL